MSTNSVTVQVNKDTSTSHEQTRSELDTYKVSSETSLSRIRLLHWCEQRHEDEQHSTAVTER